MTMTTLMNFTGYRYSCFCLFLATQSSIGVPGCLFELYEYGWLLDRVRHDPGVGLLCVQLLSNPLWAQERTANAVYYHGESCGALAALREQYYPPMSSYPWPQGYISLPPVWCI